MRIDVPFEVQYLTPGTVPIDEIIGSLTAVRFLLEETSQMVPRLVDGAILEHASIGVRSITHESPLRELFVLTLVLAFQENLTKIVPGMIQGTTGLHIPDDYRDLVTVITMIVLFYGVGYIKDVVSSLSVNSEASRQLDALIGEMAERTGHSKDEIRKRVSQRYKQKGVLSELADAAIGFFKPSKSQGNSPVVVGGRHIGREVVAEVPSQWAVEQAEKDTHFRHLNKVRLTLYAQDREKDSTGWAAIAEGISERRIKMKLVDGVTPGDLWNRDHIVGDVVVQYRREGLDFVASELHLTKVHQ